MNAADLIQQLKELIVKELQLEDISPDDIDSSAPIFGEGLGLDSIDALELSIAINRTFGVAIQPDDADHRQVFASVNSLAQFIETQGVRTS